jgi:hypothetical protein
LFSIPLEFNVSEFLQHIGIIVLLVAVFFCKPHGMMEYWNVGILGMKSGRHHFIQIMLNLHLFMMLVRHPFSAFISEMPYSSEKNNAIIGTLILSLLKPIITLFQNPLFHYSSIPSFQLGEAPNLFICP